MEKKMSQFAKPSGFFGKMLAYGMAMGHRDFYKNSARILDLKQDDKYLELGFGSGIFIKKYASHASKVSGLDYSEEMVKLASEINKDLVESGKAEFRHGNVSSIPWNDNVFSAAATIETFFFWPEPEAALKEIHRVLEPGGRLVIEMAYNNDDGLDHSKLINKMNLRLFSGDEMKNLLKRCGYVNISIEYYKGFWAPIKGVIGIAADRRTITGIAFYEQNETPGLGGEIIKSEFRAQFKDKRIAPQGLPLRILPVTAELDESSVHAITGATQTSNRLDKFMNEQLTLWRERMNNKP